MPKWFEKILKYNHGEKSLKAPFTIILDLECLLLKMHSCQDNPGKSYPEKKAKHEPSGLKSKKYVSYVKKSFVQMKMMNLLKSMKNLKSTKKLKIIAITPGNLEEQLRAFAN